MPNQSLPLDQLFQALADPTRRAVVEQLTSGPATVSELSKPFRMALPSFTQHLGVLEQCGLVRSHKQGRSRTYQLVPESLQTAEHWMAQQRRQWERRLDQLDSFLTNQQEQQP